MNPERKTSMKNFNARKFTVTAIMGAVASVLMHLSFSTPVIPAFIKLDFSELPALIAAFAMGPLCGVSVCLIKNLISLITTSTAGVGELSNFLLGVTFVLPAGLIYKKMKNLKGAVIASLIGAVVMGILSIPINYFITYPAYIFFYRMPLEGIMAMYQAINPKTETLLQALVWFNAPFTCFKGLCDVVLTFLIYKRISPIIKGK